MEIEAEVLLKATKVDGVYAGDPVKDPSAQLFDRLTYQQYIEHGLKVMDMTAVTLAMGLNLPIIVFNMRIKGNIIAVSLAMGRNLPIVVFDLQKEGNIRKVVFGNKVGTLISGEEK